MRGLRAQGQPLLSLVLRHPADPKDGFPPVLAFLPSYALSKTKVTFGVVSNVHHSPAKGKRPKPMPCAWEKIIQPHGCNTAQGSQIEAICRPALLKE